MKLNEKLISKQSIIMIYFTWSKKHNVVKTFTCLRSFFCCPSFFYTRTLGFDWAQKTLSLSPTGLFLPAYLAVGMVKWWKFWPMQWEQKWILHFQLCPSNTSILSVLCASFSCWLGKWEMDQPLWMQKWNPHAEDDGVILPVLQQRLPLDSYMREKIWTYLV